MRTVENTKQVGGNTRINMSEHNFLPVSSKGCYSLPICEKNDKRTKRKYNFKILKNHGLCVKCNDLSVSHTEVLQTLYVNTLLCISFMHNRLSVIILNLLK